MGKTERKIQGPFKKSNVKEADERTMKAAMGVLGAKDPTIATDVQLGLYRRKRRQRRDGAGSETDTDSGSESSSESEATEDPDAKREQVTLARGSCT